MVKVSFKFCSNYSFKPIYIYPKYSVGQTLYRCDLAAKGYLEKVTIKQVLLNPPKKPIVAIYKDTFNSLHMETDLCSQEDAMFLYQQYLALKKEFCDRRYLHDLCLGFIVRN